MCLQILSLMLILKEECDVSSHEVKMYGFFCNSFKGENALIYCSCLIYYRH